MNKVKNFFLRNLWVLYLTLALNFCYDTTFWKNLIVVLPTIVFVVYATNPRFPNDKDSNNNSTEKGISVEFH